MSLVHEPVHMKQAAWLLTYDIADKRRWQRLYRLVRGEGIRLQYSVFLLPQAEPPQGFCEAVGKIVHPQEDDVRMYYLPIGTRVWYAQNSEGFCYVDGLPW